MSIYKIASVFLQAYFIGIVWNCYKYLTLRNAAAQRTIHFIDPDSQSLLPDLPDYETAMNDPYYYKKAANLIPPPPAYSSTVDLTPPPSYTNAVPVVPLVQQDLGATAAAVEPQPTPETSATTPNQPAAKSV